MTIKDLVKSAREEAEQFDVPQESRNILECAVDQYESVSRGRSEDITPLLDGIHVGRWRCVWHTSCVLLWDLLRDNPIIGTRIQEFYARQPASTRVALVQSILRGVDEAFAVSFLREALADRRSINVRYEAAHASPRLGLTDLIPDVTAAANLAKDPSDRQQILNRAAMLRDGYSVQKGEDGSGHHVYACKNTDDAFSIVSRFVPAEEYDEGNLQGIVAGLLK